MTDKIQSPPRKPDLLLKVLVRVPGPREGKTATVGAGWVNADGSISLQLHPGATIAWNDGLQLALFPNDRAPR